MKLKNGDFLTVDHDVINDAGEIVLIKGQKVTISEVDTTLSKWSNFFGMFMPEKINWIKLEEVYGMWFLSTFMETKQEPN
jgi:hypothetical protein